MSEEEFRQYNNRLGMVYFYHKKYNEAIYHLNLAATPKYNHPGLSTSQYNLSFIYFKFDKIDISVKWAKRSVSQNYPQGMELLGKLYIKYKIFPGLELIRGSGLLDYLKQEFIVIKDFIRTQRYKRVYEFDCCPICLEEFNCSKFNFDKFKSEINIYKIILKCGHSLCATCLIHLYTRVCPLCSFKLK